MAAKELSFADVGDYGVQFAVDGDHIVFRIPTSTEKARLSASGKTNMVASTAGWANIPGTNMRLNLNAGVRV